MSPAPALSDRRSPPIGGPYSISRVDLLHSGKLFSLIGEALGRRKGRGVGESSERNARAGLSEKKETCLISVSVKLYKCTA